ncbi:MAG TPA: PEGA domain-containing protein [Gemmatimonadales bacterium]|nr:PEGA domain-containing protein [Gemmatimonadales bacterium]
MRWFAAFCTAVLMTGCASVIGSKQADFSFNSNPQQAQVLVDGNAMGETPLKVKLSNTKAHTITFRKEGYQDVSCQLEKGTDAGWVVLDVVSGLVPVIIDAATNNWSQTKSHECTRTLAPAVAAAR